MRLQKTMLLTQSNLPCHTAVHRSQEPASILASISHSTLCDVACPSMAMLRTKRCTAKPKRLESDHTALCQNWQQSHFHDDDFPQHYAKSLKKCTLSNRRSCRDDRIATATFSPATSNPVRYTQKVGVVPQDRKLAGSHSKYSASSRTCTQAERRWSECLVVRLVPFEQKLHS